MKPKEEILQEFDPTYYDQDDLSQPEYSKDSVLFAMEQYASQFQQELPNVKDIVKKFIDSDEPDTFIRNEHGVLMYYSHDKQSGIKLESYFEDLVQYVYDEISAKSPTL
jgi:hypothetical protein